MSTEDCSNSYRNFYWKHLPISSASHTSLCVVEAIRQIIANNESRGHVCIWVKKLKQWVYPSLPLFILQLNVNDFKT